MSPSEFRRLRRGVLDMTQGQLAAALGISNRTVWAIEKAATDEIEPLYSLAIRALADRALQPAE